MTPILTFLSFYFGGKVYSVSFSLLNIQGKLLIFQSFQIFFFLFLKIFIFTLFYFTILYWFCHTLTRIHHGCTWVPKHEPPSHLPPHIISLDHPCAPALSILYPALNIDWRFVSYMIVCMFQCHSPKSSHPYFCMLLRRRTLSVSKNKTRSWLLLKSWVSYCKTET